MAIKSDAGASNWLTVRIRNLSPAACVMDAAALVDARALDLNLLSGELRAPDASEGR